MDVSKVSRFEVIDHRTGMLTNGRVFTANVIDRDERVEFSLQDDGRTLKVFLFDAPSERDAPDA